MDVMVALDPASRVSLRDQLYDEIRRAVIEGRLAPGDRVSATRELASRLGVSRLTVEDAYARLIAEGYLVARRGAGTFVSPEGYVPMPAARADPGREPGEPTDWRWSAWGGRVRPVPRAAIAASLPFPFRSGMPAVDVFPHALWNRALARAARQASVAHRDYAHSAGDPPLRAAVAAYLSRSRGLPAAPERLVITSGFQQAFDLLVRLLIDPGDTAVVEDPGYPGAHGTLAAAGARVVTVPVDADGMRVDLLDALAPSAKLVYVTPSHQYPTGGILSLPRRWALLDWARRRGALVIEDDYDAEFRYGARPVPALAGIDVGAADVAAYLGTFSKVIYPSLRLGYAMLPAAMVDRFVAAKRLADYHSPTVEQQALAAFIDDGHFERHLARMRRLYANRRAALLAALSDRLASSAVWEPAAAFGLHMLVGFRLDLSERELAERAARFGVGLEPAGHCFVGAPPLLPSVLLGYASMPEAQIRLGIAALAAALQD